MSHATVKLLMMGSGGVGKTCIPVRLVENRFMKKYDPTYIDFFKH